jgi:hypothetical protein
MRLLLQLKAAFKKCQLPCSLASTRLWVVCEASAGFVAAFIRNSKSANQAFIARQPKRLKPVKCSQVVRDALKGLYCWFPCSAVAGPGCVRTRTVFFLR